MRSLEELSRDLEKAEAGRDSNLLHSVMSDLFSMIGFSRAYDVYGFSAKTWDYDAQGNIVPGSNAVSGFTLPQLEAFNVFLHTSRFPVETFTRAGKFDRENYFFDVLTMHSDFADLKNGVYSTKFISSNSSLKSTRPVVDTSTLRREFLWQNDGDLLDLVLSNDGILKRGSMYFFNPKTILELVSYEPKTFYFQMVREDGS
ncbi:MAG: hypothetical protein V1645_00230 [archaeon]